MLLFEYESVQQANRIDAIHFLCDQIKGIGRVVEFPIGKGESYVKMYNLIKKFNCDSFVFLRRQSYEYHSRDLQVIKRHVAILHFRVYRNGSNRHDEEDEG